MRIHLLLQTLTVTSIAFAATNLHAQDTCSTKAKVNRVYSFKNGTKFEYTASVQNLTGSNITVDITWHNLPDGSSQKSGQYRSKTITGRNTFEAPMGNGTVDIATAGVKFITNGSTGTGPYVSISSCK